MKVRTAHDAQHEVRRAHDELEACPSWLPTECRIFVDCYETQRALSSTRQQLVVIRSAASYHEWWFAFVCAVVN